MTDEKKITMPNPNYEYKRDKWVIKPFILARKVATDYTADWYWARDGESLSDIANQYNVTVPFLSRFNWGTEKQDEVNYYLVNYCECVLRGDRYIFQGTPCLRGIWVPVKRKEIVGGKKTVPRTSTDAWKTRSCENDPSTSKNCSVETQVKCKTHDQAEGAKLSIAIGERWPGIGGEVFKGFQEAESWMLFLMNRKATLSNGLHVDEWLLNLNLDVGLGIEAKEKRLKHLKELPSGPAVPGGAVKVSLHTKDQAVIGSSNRSMTWELDAVAEHLRILKNAGVIKRLLIRGYASVEGTWEYNKRLSLARGKWLIETLETHFGLQFEPFIPVVIIGCGEFFSFRPIPWDREVVIEVEPKKPEKSKEAEEIQEVFKEAAEWAKKTEEEKRLISEKDPTFVAGTNSYLWVFTDLHLPSVSRKHEGPGRRTTLIYVNKDKGAFGDTPDTFNKIKKQASRFVDVFYDCLVEQQLNLSKEQRDKIGNVKKWINSLPYIQEGGPIAEGPYLTPWFDLRLLRSVSSPPFLRPALDQPGNVIKTINVLNYLDMSRKKMETRYPHWYPYLDNDSKNDINKLNESATYFSVGIASDRFATTRIIEEGKDFKHELPPLIIHFRKKMPCVECTEYTRCCDSGSLECKGISL